MAGGQQPSKLLDVVTRGGSGQRRVGLFLARARSDQRGAHSHEQHEAVHQVLPAASYTEDFAM